MELFDGLSPAAQAVLEQYVQTARFAEGERLMAQGDPGDGCYFIDEGTVRLEVDIGEIETDGVLGHLDAGSVVGEFSLFDQAPRSAHVWAHSDVRARHLSAEAFGRLCAEQPAVGVQILAGLARAVTRKMRSMNERLATHISAETVLPSVDAMVAAAAEAQRAFEPWAEARVDALLDAISAAIMEAAPSLAAQTVAETGIGVAAHKVHKIAIGAVEVLDHIRGRPGVGPLAPDPEGKLLEVASPMGVIFGLVPLTNPVPTVVFKTLICLKARNAIVLSCHRDALGVGGRAGDIIRGVLVAHGASADLVQLVRERGSRRKTAAFMAHPGVALILATGGPGMVRAAYSSGTPAIGVGAGNAPVLVAADADLAAAAERVVSGKSFDNGVICGSENNLVVAEAVVADFDAALEAAGALVLTPEERAAFLAAVFPGGRVARACVGQDAVWLLARAGISRGAWARLVVVPAAEADREGPLGREKPLPVLSRFTFGDEAHGIALCVDLLEREGKGHTAAIHTTDLALAQRFGVAMPASRVLVNQMATLGCIGAGGNGLVPSLTLGCGTWGGGSTTDNVSVSHLRNVRRIALGT